MKTISLHILGSMMLLFLAACSSTDANDSSGNSTAKVFDPNLPASTFVSETNPSERERIANEMWAVLQKPQCWDASFVGPSTPAGYAASVSQYTFFGNYQYRYYGFDVHTGPITLVDVGTYRGKPAAQLVTWTGEVEGLILVSDNRMEHVTSNPSGAYFSVTFWTSSGPCL